MASKIAIWLWSICLVMLMNSKRVDFLKTNEQMTLKNLLKITTHPEIEQSCACEKDSLAQPVPDLTPPPGSDFSRSRSCTQHCSPALKDKINCSRDVDKFHGDMGSAVELEPDQKQELKDEIAAGWKVHQFNQVYSDLVSLHRRLPDQRPDWCIMEEKRQMAAILEKNGAKSNEHSSDIYNGLPKTSIIIAFYNEANSTLLRTLHSIFDRTPIELIEEIILIDDGSTLSHLKEPLEIYLKTLQRVKLFRSASRLGLVGARLLGVQQARGSILTFLDSHVEVTAGWLPPLLAPIAMDPTVVTYPRLDNIMAETFAYVGSPPTPEEADLPPTAASALLVGGFTAWTINFDWMPLDPGAAERRNHTYEAADSPTMPGGIFAIDAEFFGRLGGFDPELKVWGGENLELSFKIWMCGGKIKLIPCSRVGHVFRKKSPYGVEFMGDVLVKNFLRVAAVWMDDHMDHVVNAINPERNLDYGNVEPRLRLRRELKCKSFSWYMDNVATNIFTPSKALASGSIFSPEAGLCLDYGGLGPSLKVWDCHHSGGNQLFYLSKNQEIRQNMLCLDYNGTKLDMLKCHGGGGNQRWECNAATKQLVHHGLQTCLNLDIENRKLAMINCTQENSQRWSFMVFNKTISPS